MDGASIAASRCWSCGRPHGRERMEPMVSPSSEPAPTQSEDSGPQQCLHISISGSSLELSEPVDSAHRELVPFDSDDTDDESSPSPSGTLQSQASHSTISSSFGSESSPWGEKSILCPKSAGSCIIPVVVPHSALDSLEIDRIGASICLLS